jgi:hypothetical protein
VSTRWKCSRTRLGGWRRRTGWLFLDKAEASAHAAPHAVTQGPLPADSHGVTARPAGAPARMARGTSASSSTTAASRARSSAEAGDSSVTAYSIPVERHSSSNRRQPRPRRRPAQHRVAQPPGRCRSEHKEQPKVGAAARRWWPGSDDTLMGPRVVEHDPFRGAKRARRGAHAERRQKHAPILPTYPRLWSGTSGCGR